MGKRVKKLFLSIVLAVFGAMSLVGPVFATPAEEDNNPFHTPTASDTTKQPETTTDNDTTNPFHTPTATDKDDDDNNADDAENNGETSEAAQVSKSCSDQVGSLSWIICPGTGLLGSIIDGAYNILTSLMMVNPIPNDDSTPMYIVWDYFKNFTNSVFIIFLVVVILSQLTGIGISNYGIKKVLPRIIITAILVNLSYIICTLAVDVSNIFGIGLRGVFENIENIAVSNGSISDVARNISASSIIAGVIGVGGATAAVGGALVTFGGLEGAIWMLIPIILSGVFAVIAALITMAARQSLIFILAMISPLALIAYMLPNTESWFTKWYKLFLRMLVFYPLFSILYGASSLAGLVIITSSISDNAAANSLGVILGLAVRILPLFASIPLMKMSGTVLDKIGGAFSKITTPVAAAVGGYAGSKQAVAKQKQLSASNPKAPSTRLAQYLEKRKAIREADAKDMATMHQDNIQTAVMQSRYNRKGQLNTRGKRTYVNMQQQLHNKAVRQQIDNDFDEGFESNGTDKRIRAADRKFIKKVNDKYTDAIVEEHIANSRKTVIQRNNDVNRAEKIRAALDIDSNNIDSRIHQQVLEGFNIDKAQLRTALDKQAAIDAGATNVTLTEAEKRLLTAHKEGRNFVLADAMAVKRKADYVMQSTMFELLDDTTAGDRPQKALIEAFKTKDYNTMKAAITVMAKRGDHKDIEDVMKQYSNLIVGDDDIDNIRFQKELNDTALGMKSENLEMWSWAKGNMIRRAKHDTAGNNPRLAGFIDFKNFIAGNSMEGDRVLSQEEEERFRTLSQMTHEERAALFDDRDPNKTEEQKAQAREAKDFYTQASKITKDINMVDGHKIMENVRDNKILGDNDRTVFNARLAYGQDGTIPISRYYMTSEKSSRDSVCSGKMDGEQLDSFNNYFLMGHGTANDDLFYEACDPDGNPEHLYNYDHVHDHIEKIFADMSTGQLSTFKTGSLERFNEALNEIERLRAIRNGTNPDAAMDRIHDESRHVVYRDPVSGKTKDIYVNPELKQWLETPIEALSKHSAVGMRSNMAPLAKLMLGVKDRRDRDDTDDGDA